MRYDFHRLNTGSIVFLNEIPKDYDGFEQDKDQKNLWHPLWEPCIYREQKPFRCSRGKLRLVTTCNLLEGQIVSYAKCSTCDLCDPGPGQ